MVGKVIPTFAKDVTGFLHLTPAFLAFIAVSDQKAKKKVPSLALAEKLLWWKSPTKVPILGGAQIYISATMQFPKRFSVGRSWE